MKNKIRLWLLKQWYKYADKQCPHICLFCKYRKDCGILDDNYIGIEIEKL